MNLKELASNVVNFLFKPQMQTQQAISHMSLPDPVSFIQNALTNISYKPAQFDIPNIIASKLGGGSEAYKTTMQQPIYPFRNMPSPEQFIQNSAKGLLENVLPAFIGTVPIPPATGWSLPQSLLTTAGFTGLQKLAGYKNEDVFNPVNLGLTLAAGGLKFGEPKITNTVPERVTRRLPDVLENLPSNQRNFIQPDAVTRLRGLINPKQQWQELTARGYSEEQIKRISASEFNRIKAEDIPPFMHESFQPSSFQTKEMLGKAEYQAFENMPKFNDLFKKWIGQRDTALTTAIDYGRRYKNIPVEQAPEIIRYMENPQVKVSAGAAQTANKLRNEFNALHTDAKAAGLDIGYLKDYLYHVWKESPTEIAAKYRGLGKGWGSRQIPTYEEGISIGLTPKYTHPAQILSEYVRRMESVKANLDFFKQLKSEGFIVPAGIGARTPGFEQIRAIGFPQSETIISGQRKVIGGYYAPAPIAKIINNVFAQHDINPYLKTAAKVSSSLQDITLSGGVPGTPLNAWTFAQTLKEVNAGRIKGPVVAVVRSMLNPEKYFQDNSQFIKEQQLNNIPVKTIYNIENLKPSGVFEGGLSKVWNRLVNEPTFQKFMPILQTEFYKDMRNSLVNKGYAEDAAIQTAAKATKNFYGIITSDQRVQSNATTNALKSTFLFAPHYRQTMVTFWLNSLKALKNPLAPENINNTRFLVGSILTLFAMDQANRYFNDGKSMTQNPSGTEDKLLIPVSKITGNQNDKAVIGIPFLSSIATIPRGIYRQGMSIAKGDLAGTGKDILQTYLSTATRPLADVAANRDYFGKSITQDNMTPPEKYKAIGQYLLTQYISHPYLKEIFDPRNQSDPAYQRLSRAMEAPFRFYTDQSLQGKYYYGARDTALTGLNDTEKSAYNAIPKYDVNNYDPNSTILKYQTYLTYPKVFQAKQQTELQMAAQTGKPIDPLYLVDYETAKKYMRYETLPPGSQDRKDMTKAYPELVALFDVRGKYFDQNPIPGQSTTRPVASQNVQMAMDRKDWNYPGVKEYLDANRQYQNQQRTALGLPELAGYQAYAKKPKKIAFRISKGKKLAMIKIKKPKSLASLAIKIKKAPKIKIAKLKKNLFASRPNFNLT